MYIPVAVVVNNRHTALQLAVFTHPLSLHLVSLYSNITHKHVKNYESGNGSVYIPFKRPLAFGKNNGSRITHVSQAK